MAPSRESRTSRSYYRCHPLRLKCVTLSLAFQIADRFNRTPRSTSFFPRGRFRFQDRLAAIAFPVLASVVLINISARQYPSYKLCSVLLWFCCPPTLLQLLRALYRRRARFTIRPRLLFVIYHTATQFSRLFFDKLRFYPRDRTSRRCSRKTTGRPVHPETRNHTCGAEFQG